MATQRIKLKKNVGKFKDGDTINATADELRTLKLQPGRDYDALGTYPRPVKSDLAKPDNDGKKNPPAPGSSIAAASPTKS